MRSDGHHKFLDLANDLSDGSQAGKYPGQRIANRRVIVLAVLKCA
jgi:hypothetical protein